MRARELLLFAAAVLLSGCAMEPMENAMLQQARSAYADAKADPLVAQNARLELTRAGEILASAEEMTEDRAEPDKVTHYAYLARQQTAIAREAAQLKMTEEAVAAAGAERERILRQVRAAEAERARQQAMTRQQELEEARRQMEVQAQAAEESRQRALARAAEAEEARQRNIELERQLGELEARRTSRGIVLTLSDVLFDLNEARLNPGSSITMDKMAEFLKDNPERRIRVEGFTDSTGAEDYNQQLSERRAEAVRNALTDRGIASDRIEIRGYGEEYPVASNDTAAGRQQNRRVEIIISDEQGQIPARTS